MTGTHAPLAFLLPATLALVLPLSLCGAAADADATPPPRERHSFDQAWHFHLGDPEGAARPDFDHAAWRALDLPHDWSIEGPFDPDNPCGAPGAYLPCGIGWYRKSFTLPMSAPGKRVFIQFDGVYMNSQVWINGHFLGKRPNGYLGFEYELTPHLKPGQQNTIAVRVDNALQPSSRWYTGSGIYRHVWLTLTNPARIANWGVQVTTPKITRDEASVRVTTRLDGDRSKPLTVTQTILGDDGKAAATTSAQVDSNTTEAGQDLALPAPRLWSPDSPSLYTLRTEVRADGRLVDLVETPFGVRHFEFDAKRGLLFNGEPLIMKGVCNHHDLGPLGAALWDDALERRLRQLKAMGCNAIRTAHNPSSEELLHLCDRLGFLVINETFDEWRRGWAFEDGTLVSSKTPKGKARFGYHLHFDKWAERDLTDHIARDFNHPSVIMWSVGNEVPEAQKYGEIETLKWLRKLCHKLDPTRPMTVGCNFIEGANATGFTEHMDVVGYNGGGGSCWQYQADHAAYPHRKMYASEVPHSLQTRGEYRTHSRYREPERQPPHLTPEELFPETDAYYESSYDNAGVRISARDSWRLTSTLPFFAGEFRWTGFDYLGESGGWPRVLGNFGIIDICHFPKDTYYYYQSRWTEKPMVHLLPHWNWPGQEGVEIPVWAYTNAEEVELFLNGKSLGARRFNQEFDQHLQWMVPYAPGTLRAIARRGGREIAATTVQTSGPATTVAIDADQDVLQRASRQLSYVTIRIEDDEGRFHPTAEKWVRLNLSGPGRIVAVGNGDPLSHASFQGNTVRTFNGLALAIIASDRTAVERHASRRPRNNKEQDDSVIVLQANSKGMNPAEIQISTTPGS